MLDVECRDSGLLKDFRGGNMCFRSMRATVCVRVDPALVSMLGFGCPPQVNDAD